MKVIDLTHTIRENMPVYPGTEPPRLLPASTYEKDGFKETLLQMYTHTEPTLTLRPICTPAAPLWISFLRNSLSAKPWSSTAAV